MFKYTYKDILKYAIVLVWICNCLVASLIAIHQLWIPYMDAGSDAYTKIISDPFDGYQTGQKLKIRIKVEGLRIFLYLTIFQFRNTMHFPFPKQIIVQKLP